MQAFLYVLQWTVFSGILSSMEIKNKEELISKLKEMFTNNLNESLVNSDMDEDEKNANIILSRKKIQADSEQVANLVFLAYGE